MSIKAAVRSLLLADAGVAALIGTKVHLGDRVPTATPMPYVAVVVTGDGPVLSLGGPTKYCLSDWMMHCVAKTNTEAVAIATAVRAAILHKKITAANGYRLQGATEPESSDETEQPADGASVGFAIVTLRISIPYLVP